MGRVILISALGVEIASFCQNNKVFSISHGNVCMLVHRGEITSVALHYLASEVISMIISKVITAVVIVIQ